MKLLLAAAAVAFAGGVVACKSEPSKLEKAQGSGIAAIGGELGARLQRIDDRLKKLEELHKVGAGGPNDPITDRLHRIEISLAKREEALGFLDLAYGQQKDQLEQQQAEEPDPNAVFAVDIAAPLKAGQVEGANSATVTVVEAWDFA